MSYGTGISVYGSIHDLLTCPYNKSHQVGASRFPNHLVKCRKQHPELAKDMLICNYNQSHHVLRKDMDNHLTVCEDYKAHLMHSINSCRPSYLPHSLHKPLANSVNPAFKACTQTTQDDGSRFNDEFDTVSKEEDLDDWI